MRIFIVQNSVMGLDFDGHFSYCIRKIWITFWSFSLQLQVKYSAQGL